MTFWGILKHFNYSQLWQLLLLALKYPIYVYPTLKATVQSFKISRKEFPESHGKNGKANAFRHAFWNALICHECKKWGKNRHRILAWTKLITDKHEELSPNQLLDKCMDLHNNSIGRNLFIASSFTSTEEIIATIKFKLTSSKKIETIEDAKLYPTNLVYIKEE